MLDMKTRKFARWSESISSQFVADDGEIFERTGGPVGGYQVFAKARDWERAVRLPDTDNLLYVLTEQSEVVPLLEFQRNRPNWHDETLLYPEHICPILRRTALRR